MNALERMRRGSRTDRAVGLAVLFFSIRAVVPVGYMPAPIAEGGPFALCRGASAATLAMLAMVEPQHSVQRDTGEPDDYGAQPVDHVGHSGDHAGRPGEPAGIPDEPAGIPGDPAGHSSGHDVRWERCPLGIGAADAAVAFAASLPPVDPAAGSEYSSVPELLTLDPIRRFQARGPPA